jgi:hypothetical protein
MEWDAAALRAGTREAATTDPSRNPGSAPNASLTPTTRVRWLTAKATTP